MYTIQISKHIKISFYNFCSNQFFLLVCHSANCVVCKTEFKSMMSTFIHRGDSSSVFNTFSFVGCVHRAFSSSPSVQSCEFTIRIIQVYRAGRAVWLDSDGYTCAPRSGMLLRVCMAEYMKWIFTPVEPSSVHRIWGGIGQQQLAAGTQEATPKCWTWNVWSNAGNTSLQIRC